MKISLVVGVAALVAGGCGKSASTGGGPGSGGADKGGGAAALPDALAAWMPKEAAAAWEGAWATRMSPLQSGGKHKSYTSAAGDAIAVEVKGAKATVWGGGSDVAMTFALVTPCVARFTESLTEGSLKGGSAFHDQMFVIDGGKLVVGSGAAGYRKGKTAIVCSEGFHGGATIVDDKGGCQTWENHFDKLEAKPDTCVWSQDGGKDVLTIGSGDWKTVVKATGDVLESDQFAETTKYTTKAKDLADAKAQTQAILDKDDPGVQAKAAGGEAGKTDTIVSLTATLASDKSAVGKPLTMTGVVKQTGTMTANGVTKHQTLLVDAASKDDKFDMFCIGSAAPPAGVNTGDTVTASGTLADSFDKPELDDCTIVKK